MVHRVLHGEAAAIVTATPPRHGRRRARQHLACAACWLLPALSPPPRSRCFASAAAVAFAAAAAEASSNASFASDAQPPAGLTFLEPPRPRCTQRTGDPAGRLRCDPDFFLIGASKGGTTSFSLWLQQHPAVFHTPPVEANEESHVFDHRWRYDEEAAAATTNVAAGAGDGRLQLAPPPQATAKAALKRMAAALDATLPLLPVGADDGDGGGDSGGRRTVVMDYTPNYFVSPQAPLAICGVLGWSRCQSARYLLLLREPVARTLSSWSYKEGTRRGGATHGVNHVLDLAIEHNIKLAERWLHCYNMAAETETGQKVVSGADGGGNGEQEDPAATIAAMQRCGTRGVMGDSLFYLHVTKSIYYRQDGIGLELDHLRRKRQLRNWLAVIPRQKLLVLRLEDIMADPIAQLRAVFRFLALKEQSAPAAVAAVAAGQPTNAAAAAVVATAAATAGDWVLPPPRGDPDWAAVVRRVENVTPPHPELAAQVDMAAYRRLAEYFAPHNRRLDELLGWKTGYAADDAGVAAFLARARASGRVPEQV